MSISPTLNSYKFIQLFFLVSILLLSFYLQIKAIILKIAPRIAIKTRLIKHHPLSQVIGVIELSVIAISHVLFCVLLAHLFHIDIVSAFKNASLSDYIYGSLIGIGCVGTSILLCTVSMKLIEYYAENNAPKSLSEWLAISGAGWIRHHNHIIKVLPSALSLFIILLQIGSEETIFRSILIQLFQPFGTQVAFMVSTTLFILMQTLHMPNMLSAMFPVIGATVMGITHGLLYIYHPTITPLIISHLVFFIFTLI